MTRTEKTLLVIFFILFFTVYGVLLHQHDVGMDKVSDEWVQQMAEDFEMFPEDWD